MRFEDVSAASLRSLLDRIRDSDKLDEIGDWILSCEKGKDFLGRFNVEGGRLTEPHTAEIPSAVLRIPRGAV